MSGLPCIGGGRERKGGEGEGERKEGRGGGRGGEEEERGGEERRDMVFVSFFFGVIIGVSLSEPHTSVTALRMHVCMLVGLDRPLTVNFK